MIFANFTVTLLQLWFYNLHCIYAKIEKKERTNFDPDYLTLSESYENAFYHWNTQDSA